MEDTGNKEEQINEEESTPRPWKYLAELFGKKNELYEKTMFLQGYEFSSNIYLIVGDYLTMVDPGNDYTSYMELFELGFTPGEIKKIVLTHGHRDHAMGIFELVRAYPSIMENGGFEVVIHEEGPDELKALLREGKIRYSELKGGERLEMSGFEFEVIHTPGHTLDGLTFYHGPTRAAITGDTVLPHAMVEDDHKGGGRMDQYLLSLRGLMKMEIADVLPGHGDPVSDIGRAVVEKTYEHAMMKLAEIQPGTPWIEGATALAGKGLLEEALFCAEKGIAQDPDHQGLLQIKALCLTDLGRCEEAVAVFDEVLGVEGDNPFVLAGKGSALMGLQRYEEAIEYLDRALAVKPGMKDAMVFKGMALYLLGRYDEAMDIEGFREEFMARFQDQMQPEGEPRE